MVSTGAIAANFWSWIIRWPSSNDATTAKFLPSELTLQTMATTRPVEIRLGAVKRLTKELITRRIDVETEKNRLAKFTAEGKDQWEVGKQVCSILPGKADGSPRRKSWLNRRRWCPTRRSVWRLELRNSTRSRYCSFEVQADPFRRQPLLNSPTRRKAKSWRL